MKGLTQKQKNIIEFIYEFMTTQEMAPTTYEIAEHFHIKTSTVFAHIRALQKKNYLTRGSKARSISLSHPKKRTRFPVGIQSIPFRSIGEGVQTGPADKTLVCDVAQLLDSSVKEDLYAVHVRGSNLNGSGIFDGDILIVKSNPEAVGGEDIVVAEENGRGILKQAKDALINGTPDNLRISKASLSDFRDAFRSGERLSAISIVSDFPARLHRPAVFLCSRVIFRLTLNGKGAILLSK